jgi:hypothetical protein
VRRLIALTIATILVSSGISVSPAKANLLPPLDACSSPAATNCILSFSIKTPSMTDFVALSATGTISDYRFFSGANAAYQPSDGFNNFRVRVATNDFGASLGGTALQAIDLTRVSADGSISPLEGDVSLKFVINLDSTFPGPATARAKNGKYGFSLVGNMYQFTVEASPVKDAQSNTNVFSMQFAPPSMATSGLYAGLPPTVNRAWMVAESNAAYMGTPMWLQGALRFQLSAPHTFPDGQVNTGSYRLHMTNELVTDLFGLTVDQALNGALVAQDSREGEPFRDIASTVTRLDQANLVLTLAPYTYSTHVFAVLPSATYKASTVTWSGKKSSLKRNKALTVKSSVKSNKKKAAGSIRVDFINASGVVVGSLNSPVKKGSGKVTFSKAFTKSLAPGRYTVKINFLGSGTAKGSSRSYSLKVK